jgi:hypothetical protein
MVFEKEHFLAVEKGFLPVGQIKLGVSVRARADTTEGTHPGSSSQGGHHAEKNQVSKSIA